MKSEASGGAGDDMGNAGTHVGQGERRRSQPEPDDRSDGTASEADAVEQQPGRNAAEWTVLMASALIVATLIGLALYEYLVRDEPAGVRISIELHLDNVERRDGLNYIPFTVVNTGAEAAQSVTVDFEITSGSETVQETTVDIPFLANSGSAAGELVTGVDLATHQIEARVSSFQTP